MQRSIAILLILVAVMSACTAGGPDPEPTAAPPRGPTTAPSVTTGQVAVVVHPSPSTLGAAVQDALSDLPGGLLEGRTVRVVTADDASFVPDVARLFATEGFELVCVLGSTAADVVREIAPSAPATRFCAAPAADTDLPDNVLPIDVRMEELAYVAGVALGTDLETGPVTMVPSRAGEVARLRDGLRQGLVAAGLRPPAVSSTAPATDETIATEAVEDALGSGTRGVFALAGSLDAVIRDVLVATPVTLPEEETAEDESTDEAQEEPSPTSPTPTEPTFASLVGGPDVAGDEATAVQVLLTYAFHLDRAVRLAVSRVADTWDPSPVSVGFEEGAISVTVNPDARTAAVRDAVEAALDDLQAGKVRLGPMEGETSS